MRAPPALHLRAARASAPWRAGADGPARTKGGLGIVTLARTTMLHASEQLHLTVDGIDTGDGDRGIMIT